MTCGAYGPTVTHVPSPCPGSAEEQRIDHRRAPSPFDNHRRSKPKFPRSRPVGVFGQVVEPLITKVTCLRSHDLRLFRLVNAYAGSPPGELRSKPDAELVETGEKRR